MPPVYTGQDDFDGQDLFGLTRDHEPRKTQSAKQKRKGEPTERRYYQEPWKCLHAVKCDSRLSCALAAFLNRPTKES